MGTGRHRKCGDTTWVRALLALVLTLGWIAVQSPRVARAANLTVQNGNDSGPGSLRQALLDAQPGYVIDFAPTVSAVTLTSDRLTIDKAVTIFGRGQGGITVQRSAASGTPPFQIFLVHPSTSGVVNLSGLTIRNGATPPSSPFGGGFRNQGTLILTNSVVTGNSVTAPSGSGATLGGGGGIYNGGSLTLEDTTVRGNSASGTGGYNTAGNNAFGGGVYNDPIATLIVRRSTIADNSATGGSAFNATGGVGGGGGLANYGTATLTNSTISGNSAIGGDGGGSGSGGPGTGGGIYNNRTLTIASSTLVANAARGGAGGTPARDGLGYGGGITRFGVGSSYASSTTFSRSIIAGNSASARDRNCGVGGDANFTTDLGYNVSDNADPCDEAVPAIVAPATTLLDPTLHDNGGATQTHALPASSPARDHIPGSQCGTATDQRGTPRPQTASGRCDSGAFEYQPPNSSPSPTPTPSPASSPSTSPAATPAPSPGGPAPSFADVPANYWSHDQIIKFAQRGITTGCDTDLAGTRYYCPERPVTRAEMAAFLIRTLTQTTAAPPGPATPTFSDVPADHPQYGYIEALVARGITTGCGGTEYCPDREVTRAEMAAFIIRALTAQTAAPAGPAVATFGDVPAGHPQYGFIEAMAARRITTGCGDPGATPRTYCPDSNVTRAEMAVFVIRAYP